MKKHFFLRLINIFIYMTDQNVIVPTGKISFIASGSLFIIDDRYEFLNVLSRVWRGPSIKARDKNDNSFVVITKIPNLFSNLFDTSTIIKLLKLSRFLRHDSILSYKTLLLPSRTGFQELYTVEPFMDTTLSAVISSKQTPDRGAYSIFDVSDIIRIRVYSFCWRNSLRSGSSMYSGEF